MRKIVLSLLLLSSMSLCWGETWVCDMNVYLGDELILDGRLETYKIKEGALVSFKGYVLTPVEHNDENYLLHTEHEAWAGGASFYYLYLDKRKKMAYSGVAQERSRKEGSCVVASE